MRDIDGELAEIFRTVFGDEALVLGDTMTAADVEAWDSITHIVLIFSIEEHFGIQFTSRQLETFDTVGALKAAIESRL